MRQKIRLASILFTAILLLAGCYQPTGFRDLLTTPIGQAPTETPSPTPLTGTETPTEAALPTQAESLAPTETVVAETPTETEGHATQTPTATETPTPTTVVPSQGAPLSSDDLRSPSPDVVIVAVTPTLPPEEATQAALAVGVTELTATLTPTVLTATSTLIDTSTPAEPEALTATHTSTPTIIFTLTPTATLTPFAGEPPRQPNGCPLPVDAVSLPPNRPANDLRGIPEHIDFFLHGGGTAAKLVEGLRNWGVWIEELSILSDYFDNNDQPDIALAVGLQGSGGSQYNVWVFNCLGRMLYQAYPERPDPYHRPTSLSFVEIDGAAPSELLYTLRSCGVAGCQTTWRVVKWLGPNAGDVADLLRDVPSLGDNVSGATLTDFNGDRVLELRYVEQPLVPAGAPPQRDYIRYWSLHGLAYVQTRVDRSAPKYRHQQVRAADEALFLGGNVNLAIQGYQQALFSTTLLDWPEGDPSPGSIPVNAFTRFRLSQALLLAGQIESAEQAYYELTFLYPSGVTGGDIAAYATAFWESYQSMPPYPDSRRERLHAACLTANQSGAYASALSTARDFGLIEADSDLCPF